MAEAITFDYKERQEILAQQRQDAEDAVLLGNLDESIIKSEITGLTQRIGNVTTLMHKIILTNDFDNTQNYYDALWMNDLGAAGWPASFCNANSGTLSKCAKDGSRPGWYDNLEADGKRDFDAALRFFTDLTAITGPMDKARSMMMLLPLSGGFKFLTMTENFGAAGLMESTYHKINTDMEAVSELINRSWDSMERSTGTSDRYLEENRGSKSGSDLVRGYRQAMIRDHQICVDATKAHDSFEPRPDGTYTVKANVLADMRAIDKYTLEISILDNIEEDTADAMNSCREIKAEINAAFDTVKTPECIALLKAFDALITELYEFSDLSNTVYKRYKERDYDAPFCFVRKLPAFSSMRAKYSLEPITTDPWFDGTQFYKLYENAAKALGEHCADFVMHHGKL